MTDLDEREPLCARLLVGPEGRIEARSGRVPSDLAHPNDLVTPEDGPAVQTLLERGVGSCRVCPALPGWPDHAMLRVEALDQGRLRLVSLLPETDRGLAVEEMVSVVAHEVKNPLAGISGALEVVRHRSAEGSSEARILEAAHKRVRSLDRTLEDLLLLTRPLTLERTRSDLSVVAQESVELAAEGLGREPPPLALEPGQFSSTVDPRLLKRAFSYLVDHALREDPEGTQLRTSAVLGGWLLEADYRGGDLERDVQERIFDPRYLTRSRRTGLHLPVAARLIAAHGGLVRLEISPERITLSVSLPLFAEATTTPPADVALGA